MTEPIDPFELAVQAVESEYQADVYLYSGAIDEVGFGSIVESVTQTKQRDRALLILVTEGGLANSGYQIARLFQKMYDNNLSIYCPSRCKSAGTLVALGADQLIMDVFSELGPLDVQLIKQNEIMSRKSGLLARSSFDALADNSFELYERLMMGITLRSGGNVSFQLASEVSAGMAAKMMSGVYDQINPDIVGSEKRDLEVARAYGERLIACSKNATVKSVFRLVHNYPSHGFIIDNDEAADLFNKVDYPSDNLYNLVGLLGEIAYGEARPVIACALSRSKQEDPTNDELNDGEGAEADPEGPEIPLDDGGHADRPSNPKTRASRRKRNSSSKPATEKGSEGQPLDKA